MGSSAPAVDSGPPRRSSLLRAGLASRDRKLSQLPKASLGHICSPHGEGLPVGIGEGEGRGHSGRKAICPGTVSLAQQHQMQEEAAGSRPAHLQEQNICRSVIRRCPWLSSPRHQVSLPCCSLPRPRCDRDCSRVYMAETRRRCASSNESTVAGNGSGWGMHLRILRAAEPQTRPGLGDSGFQFSKMTPSSLHFRNWL